MARRLAALGVIAWGCSGPEAVNGPPAEAIVRLLDRASEAAFDPPPGTRSRRELVSGPDLQVSDWWPLIRLDRQATDGEQQAFLSASMVRSNGVLELGGQRGAFMHVVEVGPGVDLVAEAVIETAGLVPSVPGQGARLGVVEFRAVPSGTDVQADLALMVKPPTWGSAHEGDGKPVRESFLMTTRPETRAVGLICAMALDLPVLSGGVSFRGIALAVPDDRDRAAAVTGIPAIADPSDPMPLGRVSVAMTTRPGMVLLPGAAVTMPVHVPRGPGRFEARVACLSANPDPSAVQGSATVTCEVESATGWIEVGRVDLESDQSAEARWWHLGGRIPDQVSGTERRWRLRSTGEAPAVPVVAAPRLVPDRSHRPGWNVVIISVDTLRRDRVGLYGEARDVSPRLDRWAKGATVFTQAWAPSPYTLPSHMSLFSGQSASVHGVQGPMRRPDSSRTRLLAEILAGRGWTTGAFTGGGYLHSVFGFDAGFDRYGSIDPATNLESARIRQVLADTPGLSETLARENRPTRIARWIEDHADESFLLFVHTYAVHEFDPTSTHLTAVGADGPGLSDDRVSQAHLGLSGPPPAELPNKDRQRLDDLYAGAVRQADDLVGAVLDSLADAGLVDKTIVVVTSDHGKEIGEHGRVQHGLTLYEELLAVPLVVRVPGRAPGRRDDPVSLIDVAPTVLGLLGLDPPAPMQGHDLYSDGPPRELWAEVDHLAVKTAVRYGNLKTIHSPLDADAVFGNDVEWEAFDLGLDPRESTPGPGSQDQRANHLARRDALDRLGAAWGQAGSVEALPSDVARQLRALGYLID